MAEIAFAISARRGGSVRDLLIFHCHPGSLAEAIRDHGTLSVSGGPGSALRYGRDDKENELNKTGPGTFNRVSGPFCILVGLSGDYFREALEPRPLATICVAEGAPRDIRATPDQRLAMAIKAFFALALVLSVTIGLLLPTPGAHKAAPTQSSIQTIELRRG